MIGSIVTLENLYLNVPFEAKDAAKDAGAKWDAASKLWYAPPEGRTKACSQHPTWLRHLLRHL